MSVWPIGRARTAASGQACGQSSQGHAQHPGARRGADPTFAASGPEKAVCPTGPAWDRGLFRLD
eukprot:14724671-Alexandrium_andersonii.AAC.1